MLEGSKIVTLWHYFSPLTALQNKIVPLGVDQSPYFLGRGCDVTWLCFTAFANQNMTLHIEGSWDNTFAVSDALIAPLPILAGVVTTTYNLPAPMGQDGLLVVTAPYIRMRLVDTSGVNHATTRFSAKGFQ